LWHEIERRTGIKQSQQSYIKKKAHDRGFRPDVNPQIFKYYVEDGLRTGRPKVIISEIEQQMLKSIRADKVGQEKLSKVLA
jgi:hypothetical protein